MFDKTLCFAFSKNLIKHMNTYVVPGSVEFFTFYLLITSNDNVFWESFVIGHHHRKSA